MFWRQRRQNVKNPYSREGATIYGYLTTTAEEEAVRRRHLKAEDSLAHCSFKEGGRRENVGHRREATMGDWKKASEKKEGVS